MKQNYFETMLAMFHESREANDDLVVGAFNSAVMTMTTLILSLESPEVAEDMIFKLKTAVLLMREASIETPDDQEDFKESLRSIFKN